METFLTARKEWKIKLHAVSHYGVIHFLTMIGKNFTHHHVDIEVMGSYSVRRSLIDRECDFGILTLEPPVEEELDFFCLGKAELVAVIPENHPLHQHDKLHQHGKLSLTGC